jgi:hypothetical protein
MKIYSIKEIVKATNNFINTETEIIQTTNNLINPETEIIIKQAENSLTQQRINKSNDEKPLLLTDEILNTINQEINSLNYKIKIKPEIKDHMINELYFFLKKKIKKNTLKLIIDEQVEIKNLKYKNITLKKNKDKLEYDYNILQNNLNNLIEDKKQLRINNEVLQDNLNLVNKSEEELNIEYNKLKNKLNEVKLNLDEAITKNRSFEINNAELKNTISRYVVNTKKLQEKISVLENSKNLEFDNETKKVQFYQDENIRLSSELLLTREKNLTIKKNLDIIETEKENISGRIKALSKSINDKTNIVSTSFIPESKNKTVKNIDELNDKDQKSLDEVISRIFAKI